MSIVPSPARALPPHANLEQQKKQARELLNAARAGDPGALRRLCEGHPKHAGRSDADLRAARLSLHDAQLVLAREYGFSSWPKLKAHLEAHRAARRTRAFERDLSYYEGRAEGLLSAHAGGVPASFAHLREWHPAFADADDDAIRSAALTMDDARLVYAREHGFESWEGLKEHVAALARGERQEPFMQAFEAIKAGDGETLAALLRQHPDLPLARGTNGNTLLNLAGSFLLKGGMTGGPRPRTDGYADRLGLIRLLLDHGADPNQANNRGHAPIHQAGYGNHPDLAELLISRGASPEISAHGEGGTPLAMALFWGHREAAERLAAHGLFPRNLRTATGLGLVDVAREMFHPDGSLKPEAGQGRAFYRPHTGFPAWQPSDDPQEILDEALVWAARSNRVEIMPFLVERGADLNGDPYRGTPLAWAAAQGRLEAAAWLLDHGADIDRRGTFGGPSHGKGVTALHVPAQNGMMEVVRFLVERGADPTIQDDLYRSTPAGWAGHFGHTEVRDYLLAHTPARGS